MRRRRCFLLIGVVAATMFSLCARAADETPEEMLKARSLRKFTPYFVLPDESAATKKFHEVDALRKKVADAQQKATAADGEVEKKKKLILDYAEKRRVLRAQIDSTRSVEVHNRLITMSNELVDRSIILEKSDKAEKDAAEARAAASAASEQYIEFLLQLRKQYDQVEEKYEQLAADAKVQQAIEEFNKTSPKPFKLGPTGAFALLDRNLRKLEASVLSETIALRRGGGNLWHVTVTFNGKHAEDFAIDTGASLVSLPYKVAKDAGLTPSAQDPIIRVSLADGSIIEAKLVIAQSVRVGKFVVENVECGVMPEGLPNAEPLLGLAFLKHFTFKIDNAKGKLTMSKVEQQPDKGGRRVAGRPGPREKTGEPRESKTDDGPPAVPAAPVAKPDVAAQIVQLLKPGADQSEAGITLRAPGGEPLSFLPCKQGPAETLSKRFGTPDEVVKLPLKRTEGGVEKSLQWKVWSWGKVRILVDENGKTRYYAVTEE